MRLKNKVAIITGAASGIGRASAIMFAKEDAKVVVSDIDDAGGQETVESINSSGGEAIYVHADVGIASDVENLVKLAVDTFGKVDILFNNAGYYRWPHKLEEIDEEETSQESRSKEDCRQEKRYPEFNPVESLGRDQMSDCPNAREETASGGETNQSRPRCR